ncbi:MAG: glycosyltransferase family 92 protein, partial [Chlamydiia bacterium]|nr:glycosyltransferase family 92 protein [Chlamydiia bacterium]
MGNIFRLFVFSLIAFTQMEGYFATISTVFRDEAPYFKEWIEYHRLIGFDHFIVYDDNSADNYMEVLQPYIDQGLVEVVDWSFYRREVNKSFHEVQRGAYRDSLRKCQKHSEWMAFLDIDEFVLPMQDR